MKAIERLYEYFEKQDIAPTRAEKEINISNGYFSSQRKRNADLGESILLKIVDKYRDLSIEWLMTGEGEMITSKNSTHNKISNNSQNTDIHPIPLIPIEAIAGLPKTDNIGVLASDCEHYCIPEFSQKGADYLIRVSGSSMYPTYSNGDILACKRVNELLFFQWGKIYVIDSSQGALVKRVFCDDSNQDNIILASDNKDNYPPFSFPKSDIRTISIVVGVIRIE